MNILFSDDAYLTYENDFSNLINQVVKVLDKPDFFMYTTTQARKEIEEKHSNQVRSEELIKLINNI